MFRNDGRYFIMNMRLRRLQADYEKICTLFTHKRRIRLVKAIGTPPSQYQFEYLLSGLEKDIETQEIVVRNTFNVEIILTSSYPSMAPQCKMLTPVFHPNIAPHAICIGDHWVAGESLSNLIVRIAEMLSFQSYNIQSPLNGEAAKWCEMNTGNLPIDNFDFSSLLNVGEITGAVQEKNVICANCGKEYTEKDKPFQVCLNNHITCTDCCFTCSCCGTLLCLKCSTFKCQECGKNVCYQCIQRCCACRKLVCTNEKILCTTCGMAFCPDCIVSCSKCGTTTCVNDIRQGEYENGKFHICQKCHQEDFQ